MEHQQFLPMCEAFVNVTVISPQHGPRTSFFFLLYTETASGIVKNQQIRISLRHERTKTQRICCNMLDSLPDD